MFIREQLKRSAGVVGAVHDVRRIANTLRYNRRNKGLISEYLKSQAVKKLQIGAGFNLLDGWLSTDLNPRYDSVVYLDATKRFPFSDGTFDHVYSEHMIEHISWNQGALMLAECHRVLKSGASIRIATPDLKVLIDMYSGARSHEADAYIRWITDTFLNGVQAYKPQYVINNSFNNWGHQFIYDAEVLTLALQAAGFENVQQKEIGESDYPHFRNLEMHGQHVEDEAMAKFETMVLEARRP